MMTAVSIEQWLPNLIAITGHHQEHRQDTAKPIVMLRHTWFYSNHETQTQRTLLSFPCTHMLPPITVPISPSMVVQNREGRSFTP